MKERRSEGGREERREGRSKGGRQEEVQPKVSAVPTSKMFEDHYGVLL